MLVGTIDFDEAERLKDEQRPNASDMLAQIEANSHQAMDGLSATLKPVLSAAEVTSLREAMDGVVDFKEVERLKAQK